VFIATKFYPNRRDPVAEIEASLRLLDTDYVDLYIVHWPQGGPTWAWAGMEGVWELGYARSIGVSNFDAHEIDEVVAAAQVPPAVNQVQLSPFASRRALLEQCRTLGIVPEAYSPLGTGQYLADQTVNRIGVRIGRTPAQVLLRWSVRREIPVLAKSTHRDRIDANARIFDFTLCDADVAALDSLDRTGGTDQAREGKWW
jgi:diketogulonate reductase-like aldo/keto reductase